MGQAERMKGIRYEASKSDALINGETETEREEKRYAMVPLSEDELLRLLRKYMVLPEDAKLHHVFFDFNRDDFMIVLKSNNFDAVPVGAQIPVVGNYRIAIR